MKHLLHRTSVAKAIESESWPQNYTHAW